MDRPNLHELLKTHRCDVMRSYQQHYSCACKIRFKLLEYLIFFLNRCTSCTLVAIHRIFIQLAVSAEKPNEKSLTYFLTGLQRQVFDSILNKIHCVQQQQDNKTKHARHWHAISTDAHAVT